jgi:hypothetical protein
MQHFSGETPLLLLAQEEQYPSTMRISVIHDDDDHWRFAS